MVSQRKFELKEQFSKRRSAYEKQRAEKFKRKFNESFNNECLICLRPFNSSGMFYQWHEINVVEHPSDLYHWKLLQYSLVPLCGFCHYAVHLMINGGHPFEDILEFLGWQKD